MSPVWRGWALGAATTVLTAATAWQALVAFSQDRNPALALRLDGANAAALGRMAEQQWLTRPASEPRPGATAMALASLRQQALNARAIRLIGFAAGLHDGDARTEPYALLAERVSRRDVMTQLWLIEDSATKGDIPAVLRHYDIALRTSVASRPVLFSQLASALDDASIRSALRPYVGTAPWMPLFVAYVLGQSDGGQGARVLALAQTITEAGGLPETADARPMDGALLGTLVAMRQYAAALSYYRAMPGAVVATPTSVRFDRASIDPHMAPVSWQANAGGGVWGRFETGDHTVWLHAGADPGRTGRAATKQLYLPAGTYRLSATIDSARLDAGATASVVVQCVSMRDARVAATLPIPASASAMRVSAPLVVPADCPAQVIGLDLVGGDDQLPSEITLRALDLSGP